MKKQMVKRVLMAATAVVLMMGMAACGSKKDSPKAEDNKTEDVKEEKKQSEDVKSQNEDEKKHVVIGGTTISQVTYEAIKPHFEKQGYTTEFVVFEGNPVVLEACNSGEVDMAIGQHKKFVESFNENNDGSLAMAKPYGYYTGIGLYSEKYTSVDELPEGAQIAIMNDAMNMDIALRILEAEGLIKIDESVDLATVADIIDNPKGLKIIDVDQGQTVTSLKDMDAACVFFTHMSNAGLNPASYIARDTQMIKYPMGVIVNAADAQSDWAVAFAEGFKIAEVRDAINDTFPGVFEFYEDDAQAE